MPPDETAPPAEKPRFRRRNRHTREENESRQMEAYDLRRLGMPFTQVAKRLGCSERHAYRYVEAAHDRLWRHFFEGNSQRALVMEMSKLDTQSRALWPLAMGHKETRVVTVAGEQQVVQVDVPPNIEAHNALLAIAKRRALLLGLDMPKEVSIRAHMTVETATMIWGFDPMEAFPEPVPQPQLTHANGGDQGANGGNGAQGTNGTNGGDPDDGSG